MNPTPTAVPSPTQSPIAAPRPADAGWKRLVKTAYHGARLAAAWPGYLASGKTSEAGYLSMIQLFTLSRGLSNDLMHRLVRLRYPPYRLAKAEGVLGNMDAGRSERVASDLRDRGYHVFQERLPDAVCDALLDFSLREEAQVRLTKADKIKGLKPSRAKFDRANPLGVRYEYDEDTNLRSPEIQRLMCDPSLLAVAQAYLGCRPILDIVAFWWHTAFSDQPDEEAAQFYHFDMDRLKWLKFFFYVTDVTPENGPHCFVAGSQRTGGIPDPILRKGYQRLADEEVRAAFPDRRDFIEFTAPRGTIIAEDTRGLHKGKHVKAGDRLVFQIEFCDSLFGAGYRMGELPRELDPGFAAALGEYPRLFSKFHRG